MIITSREYIKLIQDLEYYKKEYLEEREKTLWLENTTNKLRNIILLKEKEIKKLKSNRRINKWITEQNEKH